MAFSFPKKLASSFCILHFAFCTLKGQSSPFPPGSPASEIVDRLEILTGRSDLLHTGLRPFLRKDAVALAIHFDTTDHQFLLEKELEDLRYLYDESNEYLSQLDLPNTLFGKNRLQLVENQRLAQPPLASRSSLLMKFRAKPLARYFYRTPSNLFEVNSPHFRLRVNPILDFELGRTGGDRSESLLLNRRGIEVRGDVDDRLFFTTNLIETQAALPRFADERFQKERTLPGANYVKTYNSRVLDIRNQYDFGQSEARVGFHATHHVGVEFGRATHFIGNGYRSLLLSDFAAPMLFLKFNTKVWRLHYQNLFAELIPEVAPGDTLSPRKYLAAHYLSLNLTRNWSVGLFEAVVLHRSDQFELNYLNPVIFYRTVEGAIGSPDNALLGLNTRLNLGRRAQLYGQFMLDEFLFSELVLPEKGHKGWWGNKFGVQLGAKCLNLFGIDHLDAQAELNLVRPYTYSHIDSVYSNYAHYGLPLAHPLVSNFGEVLFRLKWSPAGRFSIESKTFFIKSGDDPPGQNLGNNIQSGYETRPGDYGHKIGQGIGAQTILWSLDMNYRIFHNAFVDLRGGFRNKASDDAALSRKEFWAAAGFRMNIGAWKNEF